MIVTKSATNLRGSSGSVWIVGAARTGKTTRLVNEFAAQMTQSNPGEASALPGVLVLSAIGDNRLDLSDRLVTATDGKYPFYATTPLGFFQDEVTLFWTLLIQQLDLKAQFPVRLTPETEQELATQLWRAELDQAIARPEQESDAPFYAVNEARLVRRILDLLQLAALAGIPIADIPTMLEQGLGDQARELPIPLGDVGEMLQRWQNWCLERGFLTYSLTAMLYSQHLLSHPLYQHQLTQRYRLLLADDVDEYPAIAREVFEILLNAGVHAVFTYNPDGAVRLGLGADPAYLARLASRCRVQSLGARPVPSLGDELDESVVQLATDPLFFTSLPEAFHLIQTTSRAELLQRIGQTIVTAVQAKEIEPRDVAVIAPGLDPIARYSLSELLKQAQIPAEALNDQRPLSGSPTIRALLTLLTLVYPGLGRLVDRDAVAEMLVVLSGQMTAPRENLSAPASAPSPSQPARQPASRPPTARHPEPLPLIDPVRAGLLADYCFAPHPDRPRLLPVKTFNRWDRLGYQASNAYEGMVQWIETQQNQLEQRLIPNAVSLLDRAIQHFLVGGGSLPFDQLAALRQLIETAQHYWEVSGRLRRGDRHDPAAAMTIQRFIQLLRSGTVTANPYPVRPIGPGSNAVTLANVFQYRASRRYHRWQFWLDTGSPRWLSGVDALFAAPLFLHTWSGRPWTAADMLEANEGRLRRILRDLLGRVGDRVYLCHSDLATNGQEQTGVLLSLVNAAGQP